MLVLTSKSELLNYITMHAKHERGLVPTMGALHRGHLTLVEKAVSQNAETIVSIFVNPTQFDKQTDFELYPKTLAADLALLGTTGVTAVFAPASPTEVYNHNSQTTLTPGTLALGFEGVARVGHFTGVATVVSILFNLIRPSRAYFGEKDFQQLRIIEQMVRDLSIATEIIRVATERDADGLALSSRNVRLSTKARISACKISSGLFAARNLFMAGERQANSLKACVLKSLQHDKLIETDYIETVDENSLSIIQQVKDKARILVACRVDGIRLIDNISLAE